VSGARFDPAERAGWPYEVRDFWESGQQEQVSLSGDGGSSLTLLRRSADGAVELYRHDMGPIHLDSIRREYAGARKLLGDSAGKGASRWFRYTVLFLAAIPWLASLAILVYAIQRTSRVTMEAYHSMAGELQRSREKLLYLARLESWQALARKTAHEVKNSLTPIRLIMEELAARKSGGTFEQQASQIVVDEVNSLERRVRAFSEFAAEPPVELKVLDANALVEERITFLRAAHPDVGYELRLGARPANVVADEDLLKAVITNLLENAAQAAGPAGRVLAATAPGADGKLSIDVHDSGPGLPRHAEAALFEPTISFKKGGMGLGLSIARKSAVLCGGDIELVKGELGGAGFRVHLAGHGS
jgi:signal transduction histidine kinase